MIQEMIAGSKWAIALPAKVHTAPVKITWYNKKWIVILLHVLAWIAIFSLPFLVRTSYDNGRNKPGPQSDFLEFYVITRLFWIGFFYLNAFFLFPRLMVSRKYVFYIVWQVFILFILSLLHWSAFNLFVKQSDYDLAGFFVYNTFTYLFILAASIAYRTILEKIQTDKLYRERENENLKTELSFLRLQVSPHFMFNVLNNMVALARKQSDQLEPSLIKLSSLMRYMLYETDEAKVSVDKEIDYLQSYIDLQQQRFGKNVSVKTSFEGVDDSYNIEPMLLIPFVENAFKHGTGLIDQAEIIIHLKIKEDILFFSVRNKYNPESNEQKDKTSGIGLTNVERRINLLYGQHHSLIIKKDDGWFAVSLQLNLH